MGQCASPRLPPCRVLRAGERICMEFGSEHLADFQFRLTFDNNGPYIEDLNAFLLLTRSHFARELRNVPRSKKCYEEKAAEKTEIPIL